MRYLHRIARAILPYKLLARWYKLTLGKDFVGTIYRIPIYNCKNITKEVGNER